MTTRCAVVVPVLILLMATSVLSRSIYARDGSCTKCTFLSRKTVVGCTCGDCLPGFYDRFKELLGRQDTNKPCQDCKNAGNVPECQTAAHQPKNSSPLAPITTLPPIPFTTPAPITTETSPPRDDTTSVEPMYIIIFIMLVVAIFLVILLTWKCPRQQIVFEDGSLNGVNTFGSTPGTKKRRGSSTDSNSVREPLFTDSVGDQRGENEEVTRSDLRIVQTSISQEWKDLGRRLNIADCDLEQLDMDHPHAGEKIYQMLMRWRQIYPDRGTVGTLCKALVLVGRTDIAKNLRQNVSGVSNIAERNRLSYVQNV